MKNEKLMAICQNSIYLKSYIKMNGGKIHGPKTQLQSFFIYCPELSVHMKEGTSSCANKTIQNLCSFYIMWPPTCMGGLFVEVALQ